MKSGMKLLAFAMGLFVGIVNAANKPKEITWQLPEPATHGYTVNFSNTENKDGKEKELHLQYQRTIEIQKTETGFLQVWTDSKPTSEFIGYGSEEKELYEEILAASKDLTLKVSLSKDGAYGSILNLAEYTAVMKTVFEKIFIKAQDKAMQTAPVDKRDAVKAEFNKRTAGFMAAMTSPAVVQKLIEKLPFAYSFFNSGGLDPEQGYALDSTVSNPFGGEPFPINIHFEIGLDEEDPGFVSALYLSKFNQDNGREILLAAVKKIAGEGVADAEIEKILKEFELTTEINLRISLETGVVQWLEYVETKRFPKSLEIETTEMTLETAKQ